jgi:hypothetical protein
MDRVHKIEATESLLKVHFFQLYSASKEYEYPIIDEFGINEKYPGFLETFDFSKVELKVLFEFISYRRKWGYEHEYFDLIPNYFFYIWDNDNPFYGDISDWIIDTKKTNDKDILSCPHPYLFTDFITSQNNDLIAVDYYNLILLLNKKDEIIYHWDKAYHECDCKLTFINEEYIALEASYFERGRGDETILMKYSNGGIIDSFSEVSSIELFNLIIQNGVRLEIYHLSDELKSDKKIILELLKSNWFEICVLSNLNESILGDKEFILEILNLHYGLNYFDYVSENLKNDPVFIIEVVKQKGEALKYVSKALQENKEVVLEAVKQDGSALEFASEELKSDEEIVFEALVQNGLAIKFASEELKNNKEFMKRINNI